MSENPARVQKTTRITVAELRERFNTNGYWERAKTGELKQEVLSSSPKNGLTNETLEIQSQMVSYKDSTGQEVARVHQYLRSDGTLAGGGKPDPKILMEDGMLYLQQRKSQTTEQNS